jgi:hypothetical protein
LEVKAGNIEATLPFLGDTAQTYNGLLANSFTQDTSVTLPGVYFSSVAWADYNGDNKPDFLLTGDADSAPIAQLYKNTGTGFTQDTSVTLPGVGASSVAWADYNGDNKPDFLLTGDADSAPIARLYKNTFAPPSPPSASTTPQLPKEQVGQKISALRLVFRVLLAIPSASITLQAVEQRQQISTIQLAKEPLNLLPEVPSPKRLKFPSQPITLTKPTNSSKSN